MLRPPLSHLFITQDYGPDLGGMARRHVELCRRFAPDAMLVSVPGFPGDAAFDRAERRDDYEIARQPFPFALAKSLAAQMRWARWAVREVRRRGIDLVHCGNIRPAGYVAWWVRRRTGVPYILYVYGGDMLRERRKTARSPLKRRTARLIFGDAAAVVAISDWSAALARDVMREIGVRRPPPVATFDLGTDPAHFDAARDTGALRARLALGDAPVMLTVARLVPHKGQDVGIRALALLGDEFPALRYLIVGTGPDAERLRALAAELGVAERVVLAGRLSDEEIAEAYATSTIYLGASRVHENKDVEGFGIAFVEAAASGVPSVAGDSGGVRNAVRDGETAIVVPPEDPRAVADALRALLADPARRRAMGAAARRSVETHYNWDRVARETRDFAHDVARLRGGARTRGAA